MKKITFLLAVMFTSLISAQQVVVQNFQTPSTFAFAGFGDLTATIQPDPVSGGTRGNCMRLASVSTGQVWQGGEIVQSATGDKIKLTTDLTMKIDVYATQAFRLMAKVENGTGPNSGASQNYTTPNAWQTLTFTFNQSLDGTGVANGIYPKLVFFPGWNTTNNGFTSPPGNFTIHVDNITSETGSVPPPPQPTVAATTPPARAAADVKSIFSDAYAPIATLGYSGDDSTYNTSWCGAVTTLVPIATNNTNRVTGLGCEGVAFQAGRFNATTFTHFHMDIWTDGSTLNKSFNVKFSNWNNGAGEANAIEFSVTNANFLTNPNPGWISLDIPLANFAPINGASRNDLVQFVISSDLGTIFYDNLYLHKNTVLGVAGFEAAKFKIYPNPATTELTIENNSTISGISIVNMLGQQVLSKTVTNSIEVVNVSNLQSGVYLLKVDSENGSSTQRFVKK
jgi:hypothetical protein